MDYTIECFEKMNWWVFRMEIPNPDVNDEVLTCQFTLTNELLQETSDLSFFTTLSSVFLNNFSKWNISDYDRKRIIQLCEHVVDDGVASVKIGLPTDNSSDEWKPLKSFSSQSNTGIEFAKLSKLLPGMDAVIDECPAIDQSMFNRTVPCVVRKSLLRDIVMHLNDQHRWTREKIADWLDELHDSGAVDLEFKV